MEKEKVYKEMKRGVSQVVASAINKIFHDIEDSGFSTGTVLGDIKLAEELIILECTKWRTAEDKKTIFN